MGRNSCRTKNVIVVGYGSIGRRHAANLADLGVTPHVITKYPDASKGIRFYGSFSELPGCDRFTHAIIATPTYRHLDDALKLLALGVNCILIEKPIERSASRARKIIDAAARKGARIYVAYNMRFMGSLLRVKRFVKRNTLRIKIAEALVGHYLPGWRKGWDYAVSYRAKRITGGGVDLDLSHEIDYILWLFGSGYKKAVVHSAKVSSLKIDAPDIAKVILDYGNKLADITLDSIRQPKERHLKLLCEDGRNLYLDLVAHKLTMDGKVEIFRGDMVNSYKKMLRAFLGLDKGASEILCTGQESVNILNILGV